MKKALAHIEAWDEHGIMMNLFARLSDKELARASGALDKFVKEGLLRGYRAGPYLEMKQLHIQFLEPAALWAELVDLRNLLKRRHELSGPKDWSPISELKTHITEEIAKAFFATAWADAMEERGITFSGDEIYNVMPPEIPSVAREAARKLVSKMEKENRLPIEEIYRVALEKAELLDAPDIRDNFGFATALQAMGSGVSWSDDYPDHGFKVPYMEFGFYELSDEDLHLEDYL